MLSFHINLSRNQIEKLQNALAEAEHQGNLGEVKRFLAILAVAEGHAPEEAADFLRVSVQAIYQWLRHYLLQGITRIWTSQRTGRPSKLTKNQRKHLCRWIELGPEKMGFTGSCWRTPMIGQLILNKFKVFYSSRYLSELLKSLGFSYQKATFVAEGRVEKERKHWVEKQWPELLALGEKKNAHILFGDEASFPQWGSLSYTWAKRGQQPLVKTSGSRRGYKVFGLIDYFTGKFFSKGHEGKLNAESYQQFLEEVLRSTRKHIILIQDGAPYHTSQAMMEFFYLHRHRITVYQLPTYSPDFNPIEKLWKKTKEQGTHLRYFPTFDSLKYKVNQILLFFKDAKHEVLTLYQTQ